MEEKERYESSHNYETYTDEEVKSIAYKYLDYRARHWVILCMAIPTLLLTILYLVLTETYITAGILGGVTICAICIDIFWIYKTYKKEEKRLRDKYGDEFLEKATWFKKKRKD